MLYFPKKGLVAAPNPAIGNVWLTHQFTNVTDALVDYNSAGVDHDGITDWGGASQDTGNKLFGANTVTIGTGDIRLETQSSTVSSLNDSNAGDIVLEAWFRPTGTGQGAVIANYDAINLRKWVIQIDDTSGTFAGTPNAVILRVFPDRTTAATGVNILPGLVCVRNQWNYVAFLRDHSEKAGGDHYHGWIGPEGGTAVYGAPVVNSVVSQADGGGEVTLGDRETGGLLLSGNIGPIRITTGGDFLPRSDYPVPTAMFPIA